MEDSTTIQREWIALHIDILPSDVAELVPITLSADRTPALVYLSAMTKRSRRVMMDGLRIACDIITRANPLRFDPLTFPWWQLRFQHLNAIRAILLETRSLSTGNRVLAAVRGILKACWELELMDTDTYMRAINIKPIKGTRPEQAAGRMLSPGELGALFGLCGVDNSAAGVRDAAMLGLAAFAGLRRQEIADLQLENWHASEQTLHVLGKGNKVRVVPMTAGLVAALSDWLYLRGDWPGPLFTAINKGGAISRLGLSDGAVAQMVERRRAEAGIADFSPHDLRRSFISNLLDAGADLAVVQRLAGHADANTTAGYDRRNEEAKRGAVNKLHMSWQRRYT